MSRTVRRKQGYGWCYGVHTEADQLEEYVWDKETWTSYYIHLDPRSKEGKKRIAKFHSDATWFHNRYGPSWWWREFYQRPYRRMAKREIQKSLNNDEYEAIIPDMPKRGWWD